MLVKDLILMLQAFDEDAVIAVDENGDNLLSVWGMCECSIKTPGGKFSKCAVVCLDGKIVGNEVFEEDIMC